MTQVLMTHAETSLMQRSALKASEKAAKGSTKMTLEGNMSGWRAWIHVLSQAAKN